MRSATHSIVFVLLAFFVLPVLNAAERTTTPLVRTADLKVGRAPEVELADSSSPLSVHIEAAAGAPP